jgi:hypothetical protein
MSRVSRNLAAAVRMAVDVVALFLGLCARWIGGRDPRD